MPEQPLRSQCPNPHHCRICHLLMRVRILPAQQHSHSLPPTPQLPSCINLQCWSTKVSLQPKRLQHSQQRLHCPLPSKLSHHYLRIMQLHQPQLGLFWKPVHLCLRDIQDQRHLQQLPYNLSSLSQQWSGCLHLPFQSNTHQACKCGSLLQLPIRLQQRHFWDLQQLSPHSLTQPEQP